MEKYPSRPILMVDDEPDILKFFASTLQHGGINNTIRCSDSRQIDSILRENEIETILLDLMIPNLSGEEALQFITRDYPEIPVIMITGCNDVDSAVSCMKRGAFDYLLKPVDVENLILSVRRAIEIRELRHENSMLIRHFLEEQLEQPQAFEKLITINKKMRSIFKYCEAIAQGRHPVMITGETGVGKELIAQALHDLSQRPGKFVAVNVAGLDDTVFLDTLFGHVKGAFTGAEQVRKGLVESAENGTLLLDEIGDLGENSQVKLLRLLEQREYFPLGSDMAKTTNIRILVTTHKDLEQLQKSGRFRGDLYYRLRNHHVHIPPLRERKEDIPLLLDTFLEQAAAEFKKKKPHFNSDLIACLQGYDFPGNIRELKAMVVDAMGTYKSGILSPAVFRKSSKRKLPLHPEASNSVISGSLSWVSQLDPLPGLKEATQALIEEALSRAEGNQRLAASMLGISAQALNKRLKRSEF